MIDCHVHFSGSIPTDFVWQTIKEREWYFLADSYEKVKEAIEYDGDHGFDGFLNKFKIYDEMEWDEELLRLSIKSVSDNIIKENLDFVWLDFSINKYLHTMKWHKVDLINFFYMNFNAYVPNKVALVLSIKMESLETTRRQYLDLIDNSDVSQCVAGIDLVGDEQYFEADFYKPYLKKWADAGKMVRVHVGEVGRIKNVADALEKLDITNIAHGIDIVDDPRLMGLARQRNIQFDLAISSNLLIRDDLTVHNHPVHKMLDSGLYCTLGSDDPAIFKTCLAHEYDYIIDNTKQNILKETASKFTRSYGYLL